MWFFLKKVKIKVIAAIDAKKSAKNILVAKKNGIGNIVNNRILSVLHKLSKLLIFLFSKFIYWIYKVIIIFII